MKHLTRHEISRLVGIKYKGSRNQDDLDFLNQAMNHILICPTCLKQFKDKTNMLINGLNYKPEKKLKELCVGVFEQGKLVIKSLQEQFHCLSNLYLDFNSYSMNRNAMQSLPDYLIDYKDQQLIVVTFEDHVVYVAQNNQIIHYTSKIKDEMTYEYKYIFDININEEFYILIEQ